MQIVIDIIQKKKINDNKNNDNNTYVKMKINGSYNTVFHAVIIFQVTWV